MLAAFFFMSSFCFAHTDQMMQHVTNARIMEHNGRIEKSFDYLNNLINCPEVSNEDKIHYIIARYNIHYNIKDFESMMNDDKLLKQLSESFPSCKEELWKHYQIYFGN